MAKTKAVNLRRMGREVLAVAFWAHAFYATNLIHLQDHLPIRPPAYLNSVALISAIAFYSLLGKYEWISVIGDCFYIYLWPCIFGARIAWLTIKGIYKFVRSRVVVHPPGLITRPIRTAASTTVEDKAEKPAQKDERLTFWGWALKPFTEFSLLWSLLILSSSSKPIIFLASCVALFCAAKAIYDLWDFTGDASSWIEKLKGSFASQIAAHVGKVRAWEEMTQIEEVTNAANALKMLESIFTFIAENKKFLARTTLLLASCVSIGFYCYISFVFSCVYVGLGKLQGVQWGWSESFVNSLYIPFAFTNLPHNIPIQFVGGLQAVAVTLLGWNIFFRHLNSRFERIALAASELRGSFEDKVLQVKFSLIQESVTKLGPVASPGVLPSIAAEAGADINPSQKRPVVAAGRKGFRQARKRKGD